jgi:hypothetical protein
MARRTVFRTGFCRQTVYSGASSFLAFRASFWAFFRSILHCRFQQQKRSPLARARELSWGRMMKFLWQEKHSSVTTKGERAMGRWALTASLRSSIVTSPFSRSCMILFILDLSVPFGTVSNLAQPIDRFNHKASRVSSVKWVL